MFYYFSPHYLCIIKQMKKPSPALHCDKTLRTSENT